MNYRPGISRRRGFSLMELMVVMAIIAIIAALAYPSYQSSVRKTRRSDATIALTTAAAQQERWFSVNNSYADTSNLAALGGATSPEGYYTIAVENDSCDVGGRFTCFKMIATPMAGLSQANDTDCLEITIDHRGQKLPANCWRR
ncbi:type IV pilin protein [Endozoicomonadaceae bacterium StTr2]